MPSNDLENIKAGAFESRIFDVCSAFAGSGSVVVRCLDVAFVSAESESSKPETRRSAAASATSTSGPAGLSCYVFLLLFSRPFRPLRTPAMNAWLVSSMTSLGVKLNHQFIEEFKG